MIAQQDVYCCFETRRTHQAAKDERHYLLSCLRLFIIVCSWDPHDWLDSRRHFWDLKLENEGSNYIFFKAAIYGRVEAQSSSLFFVGFIVVLEEIYTSVDRDFADVWAYNRAIYTRKHTTRLSLDVSYIRRKLSCITGILGPFIREKIRRVFHRTRS